MILSENMSVLRDPLKKFLKNKLYGIGMDVSAFVEIKKRILTSDLSLVHYDPKNWILLLKMTLVI